MSSRYVKVKQGRARTDQPFSSRFLVCAGTLFVLSILVSGYLRWHKEEARVPIIVQSDTDHVQGSRAVYPYSVVPGGVQNTAELRSAVMRDPVVAQHYKGFNIDSATLIHIPIEKLAYVSYRVGNRIYWSNRQVLLARDERVLTDGSHLIRARCGNRISIERQPGNNSTAEPTEAEMDLLADNFSDSTTIQPWNEDGMIGSPATLERKTTSIPSAPIGLALRSTPSNAGAIPVPGTPGSIVAPAATPSKDSNPDPPLKGTAITVQAGQPLGGPVQLLMPNPAGILGSEPKSPPNSVFGLPTISSLPAWSGTPIDVLPATSTSAPMAPVESSVTPLLDSPYTFVPGLPLDETANVVPPVDQAPMPTTPEPGTYLLTGAGLLLMIGAIRKTLTNRHSRMKALNGQEGSFREYSESGIVQSVFRSAARRRDFWRRDKLLERRGGELKTLCIMSCRREVGHAAIAACSAPPRQFC
jgi:hypothetical protein